jgi:hypothetical protein
VASCGVEAAPLAPLCPALQYLAERKQEAEARRDARFRKGSSRHRGVSWIRSTRVWEMCAGVGGGKRVKKRCSTEEDAARCYDHIQIQMFGR